MLIAGLYQPLMDIRAHFGTNVRRLRQALGMTQDELARKMGVTLQTVFSYESGQKWPRAESFAELAKALKVNPWELLADGATPVREPTPAEALAVLARAHGFDLVEQS